MIILMLKACLISKSPGLPAKQTTRLRRKKYCKRRTAQSKIKQNCGGGGESPKSILRKKITKDPKIKSSVNISVIRLNMSGLISHVKRQIFSSKYSNKEILK